MPHTLEHKEIDSSAFTEEQRILFNRAAALAPEETRLTPIGAVETGAPLTATDLETTTALDFGVPEETAIFPVDQLEIPELEPTPTEAKAQTLTEEIAALAEGTLGVAEFTAEKSRELESALLTTQEDLRAQIKGFQIQSKSLALQRSLAAERIQQESIGRGRTVGGVAPLTAAAQRKITLQQADIAAQALTASALLSATEGKLVTARRQVEEAVEQKFAPILEELRVKEFNLDLILKSPQFSLEQKNRAQAQKDAIANQKAEVEEARAEEKALGELLIDAASQQISSIVLDEAQRSGNVLDATRILAEAGYNVSPDLTGTSSDFRTFATLRPDLTPGTPEFQTAFNAFVKQQATLKRKPVEEELEEIVIPPFEQFVDEFMETDKGKELISKLEEQKQQTLSLVERRRLVSEEVRDLYDQAVKTAESTKKKTTKKKEGLDFDDF